jgi:SAM-dependent methyltransferase
MSKYEYQYRGGKESESDQQRFREIVSTLISAIPSKEARILELGCATGGLLAALRDAGFPYVQGLDPSPGCARAAWDLYRIPVFASSLFHVPAAAGSYDFIILVGVLEHVEAVQLAVKNLHTLLAPAGRLYVEVPDGSRLAGRPDAPFQEFSTEHINFFSTVSLTNLLQLNGFRNILTGHAVRQQNENTTCPAAFGVFERSDVAIDTLTRDEETEPGLLRYIRESEGVDSRIREIIHQRAGDRQILVWGVGTHTQRLIATGAFSDVKISAFIDSSPKYQGRQLRGTPILAPSDLRSRQEPILISSRGFQHEILSQIKGQLGLENDVILLYDEP